MPLRFDEVRTSFSNALEARRRFILRAAAGFTSACVVAGCFLTTSLSDFSGGAPAASDPQAEAPEDAASVDEERPRRTDDGGADGSAPPVTFGAPIVLAPQQPSVRSVALDADDVVWMNGTTAAKVARAARRPPSSPGIAAVVYGGTTNNHGMGLVLAPSGARWSCYTGQHSVCAATKLGADYKAFSTESSGVGAWDSADIYGTSLYLGTTTRIAVTEADVAKSVTILDQAGAAFLRADASDLFFVRSEKIFRMSKGGSAVSLQVVTEGQKGVRGLVLDATRLYWVVDAGEVRSIDKSATGGAPKVLASKQPGPSSIAADSGNIYWANAGDGTIARIAKDGGDVELVATTQATPRLLVGDDKGLAWVNANGDIMGMLRL